MLSEPRMKALFSRFFTLEKKSLNIMNRHIYCRMKPAEQKIDGAFIFMYSFLLRLSIDLVYVNNKSICKPCK